MKTIKKLRQEWLDKKQPLRTLPSPLPRGSMKPMQIHSYRVSRTLVFMHVALITSLVISIVMTFPSFH